MQIINYSVSKLQKAKYNPATRTLPRNLKSLLTQIEKHGIMVPILIDKDGGIIDGHRRVAAAKILKLKEVPALIVNDDVDAKEYFESVNISQRKISNSDMIFIYLNGGQVSDRVKKVIDEMELLLGKKTLRRMGNSYVSYTVYYQAKQIAGYCGNATPEFLCNALSWVVFNKQTYAVRKAMESEIPVSTLKRAISQNRKLSATYS